MHIVLVDVLFKEVLLGSYDGARTTDSANKTSHAHSKQTHNFTHSETDR